MGQDDGACVAPDVDHVWVLDGVHLSLDRGSERTEHCARCPAIRYVPDLARKNRPPL